MKIPRLIALLTMAWAGWVFPASPALAAESCHVIRAKGTGQGQITGPDTFVGTASVFGGGLLQGSYVLNLTVSFDFINARVLFEGPMTFATHRGTLTVLVTGEVSLVTGVYSASGPVVGATGKLAGATGSLSLIGVEDLVTFEIKEEITGEVCVDLAP